MKYLIYSLLFVLISVNLFAQEKDAMAFISVKGRAITTAGDFGDDWKDGTAFYVTYGSISSNHWALMFQAGYNSFNQNNEKADYTGDAKFNLIAFQVGGRYYFAIESIRPYLLAMGGLNFYNEEYTRDGEIIDESDSQFNFQVGLGISFLLFSQLELDLSGAYNSHLIEPNTPYNITGIEYGVGFNWRLH